MSARLQRVSRAPELHAAMPPRRYTYSEFSELQSFRAPYLHTTMTACLQRASRVPCLHVGTPAARLQSSIPPRLYTCSAAPELHASVSACLQCTSSAPCLQYLHTATPAAYLQTSRVLYLLASTFLHLQRVARSPELHTSISLRLQRASRAPYLHVCTPYSSLSELQSSMPPRP